MSDSLKIKAGICVAWRFFINYSSKIRSSHQGYIYEHSVNERGCSVDVIKVQ